MLSYSFSEKTNIPLYEQLYTFIKEDIVSGSLSADTRLPSKRSFARQLSVSAITVENAYIQLLSEGFIYSLPRKGFYVSDIYGADKESIPDAQKATDNTGRTRNLSNNIKNPDSSISTGDFEITTNSNIESSYFADFTSNSTEPASFPFSTWAKLTRRILSEKQEFLMKNSPSNGIWELRSAIAKYLHDFRGLNVNPDSIIIGAGTETMYSLLIKLLGNDLVYASEDPGYEKIHSILETSGVENVRIPLDSSGIVPSELVDNKVNIIHCTPSHHFPTGISMPIKRRYEILGWAEAGDSNNNPRYIIEDDYDSEFRYSGRPIPTLFSTDGSNHVIYMNTFTKSLASTIRIRYMILPDRLMKIYHDKLSFISCTVSTFEQLTLAYFISEGYYEKHINRMRTSYRKKRDLLLRCIRDSRFSEIATIYEEQAGLHFILDLKLNCSDKKFIDRCKEREINISGVDRNSFMINYSSIPLDKIEESVSRLCSAAFEP